MFYPSFFLIKKEAPSSAALVGAGKKIKDEGCTSSQKHSGSGSYDDRLCYCSLSIYNLLLLLYFLEPAGKINHVMLRVYGFVQDSAAVSDRRNWQTPVANLRLNTGASTKFKTEINFKYQK